MPAGPHPPLIGPPPPIDHRSWRERIANLVVLVLVTVVVFVPTLRNGFLPHGFDDGLILEVPAVHQLSWRTLWAMATEFHQAHYVPLTLLSLAVDYQFWGTNPFGYHLTNIAWHAAAAVLLCIFLWSIVRTPWAALLGALVFAIHPLQMEPVSLAIQRKTLLSGTLFFLTLLFYQRWRRHARRADYVASLVTFAAAGLAKQIVVTVWLVLLLWEYAFHARRVRIVDKLPFVIVGAMLAVATIAAHTTIGAIYPPYGGRWSSHVLLMGRVLWEYAAALVLPVNLSPYYYYQSAILYTPLSFLAVGMLVLLAGAVFVHRARYPWSFFAAAWFAIVLLPESNILPLSQARADHFLYLPMVGFAIWVAAQAERVLGAAAVRHRWLPYLVIAAVVALLGPLTASSAGVWHDNVSAWRRVVERHPWCGAAHRMLGVAYYGSTDPADAPRAEWALRRALRLDPGQTDAHLYLAKLYHAHGETARAAAELGRFLERRPDDPAGRALLEQMTEDAGE